MLMPAGDTEVQFHVSVGKLCMFSLVLSLMKRLEQLKTASL